MLSFLKAGANENVVPENGGGTGRLQGWVGALLACPGAAGPGLAQGEKPVRKINL